MASTTFDPNKKFVRILEELESGMVEFEFSIGEPTICAELIMPKAAFQEFCTDNQVVFLSSNGTPLDNATDNDWAWTMRQATHQRFR